MLAYFSGCKKMMKNEKIKGKSRCADRFLTK